MSPSTKQLVIRRRQIADRTTAMIGVNQPCLCYKIVLLYWKFVLHTESPPDVHPDDHLPGET
jgi:hypothetical protein